MIVAPPADHDLCLAPELAILSALEVALVVSAQVLNIAHTEILVPGAGGHPVDPSTEAAADIIGQATQLLAAINRYRRVLGAVDDSLG